MTRLSAGSIPAGTAGWPAYRPEDHGTGIVHLGLGNFARAHLLDYTESALAARGGDWRVAGVSLRGTAVAASLLPQDCRYTLLTRGAEDRATVIAALNTVIAGPSAAVDALAAMAAPTCRIVSMTVTEKAYGIAAGGGLDPGHPAVATDLAAPDAPRGVVGMIVAALRRRRADGLPPFTVLCCDNLASNGETVRAAVLEFAAQCHPGDLAGWIAGEARFPSTMVDRITPASTDETARLAAELTGHADHAAVETEPFRQWVVEDNFAVGRPAWEAAGAHFVRDVAPYERMKLRMLNGAHSMLAYSGQLSGKTYVRDVMADARHARLVARHFAAAAPTVGHVDMDLGAYAAALLERFANPAIAHRTAQIAMDGTQKLPQRITAAACEAVATGRDGRPFAFALASWIAYVARRDAGGDPLPVDDPKSLDLRNAVAGKADAPALVGALAAVCPDILPDQLTLGPFGGVLRDILAAILRDGMPAVIAQEAAMPGI